MLIIIRVCNRIYLRRPLHLLLLVPIVSIDSPAKQTNVHYFSQQLKCTLNRTPLSISRCNKLILDYKASFDDDSSRMTRDFFSVRLVHLSYCCVDSSQLTYDNSEDDNVVFYVLNYELEEREGERQTDDGSARLITG
jgi:hypothetical protein